MRIIMHLDMDCFFAAVEVRDRPELRGKAVVVGSDPKGGKGRGVVSTANYSARKYKIKSGMPISWAYKNCPQAVFLPVHMGLYAEESKRIMQILKKYSKKFAQVSIDEAYLDLSHLKSWDEAKELAFKIQKEIKEKERLTCSIGIGPNKLIAKISSDYRKPNGFTLVQEEEIEKFLKPLKIRKLPGIGPKTEERLHEVGIYTLGHLARANLTTLKLFIGNSYGRYLKKAAQGIDNREVIEYRARKSVGRQRTFMKDILKEEAEEKIKKLSEQVYKDFKKTGYKSYKTVKLTIRYQDFETHSSQRTLKEKTEKKEEIYKTSKKLLTEFLEDQRKIRLLGVSVSKLS